MKLTCTIDAGMTEIDNNQAFGALPEVFDTVATNAAATVYYDTDTGVMTIHSSPVAIAFSYYEMCQLRGEIDAFLSL